VTSHEASEEEIARCKKVINSCKKCISPKKDPTSWEIFFLRLDFLTTNDGRQALISEVEALGIISTSYLSDPELFFRYAEQTACTIAEFFAKMTTMK
jgi:hypothetical protein